MSHCSPSISDRFRWRSVGWLLLLFVAGCSCVLGARAQTPESVLDLDGLEEAVRIAYQNVDPIEPEGSDRPEVILFDLYRFDKEVHAAEAILSIIEEWPSTLDLMRGESQGLSPQPVLPLGDEIHAWAGFLSSSEAIASGEPSSFAVALIVMRIGEVVLIGLAEAEEEIPFDALIVVFEQLAERGADHEALADLLPRLSDLPEGYERVNESDA
jgi:hypothetical protein